MNRRDVLQVLGATVLTPLFAPLSAEERWRAGALLHDAASGGQGGAALNGTQLALVTALADMLIPRTDTPGAVDVEVPRFVDHLLARWYSQSERAEILTGLEAIDARAQREGGAPFVSLDAERRASILTALDRRLNPSDPAEIGWRRLRDAIVFGYVTSQPIAELLATTPMIPGRFDGCVPMGGSR